jgi:dienelactone hydrolase
VWQHEYVGEIPVYIDSLQARLTYPLAWRNYKNADMQQWRQEARRQVLACMGPQPPRADDWQMEVLAEEQRDGYVAQRIAFNLSRWYRVKAYLLIPGTIQRNTTGESAAIILMHDHGAHLTIGKEKVIRPFAVDSAVVKDADAWVEQLYGGQYLGDYLAQNGYVVLAIDMPLWGERGRAEGADRKKYDIIAGNMMMAGVNICAFTHYDDMAAADFLASLPFVDKQRIGTAGLSIGAYRAWMLAALSDRVKAACCDCWMITTEAQLTRRYGRKENGGFANSIPGLRNYLDYPDIASLAAPNPMLFIAGKRDKLFPVLGVEKAFGIMHDVWDAAGASSHLETYLLDQGHECNLDNQRMILDFFNRHLMAE